MRVQRINGGEAAPPKKRRNAEDCKGHVQLLAVEPGGWGKLVSLRIYPP